MMIKDAKMIGVWGGRGSGKTTRLKEIVKEEKLDRVIVFDPTREWAREQGYTAFKTLRGMYKHIAQNWNKGFKCVYVVDRKANPPALLHELSEALFVIQKPYDRCDDDRKITLLIEEAWRSIPNQKMPENMDGFRQLVNEGRHFGVNIFSASQRLAEVSTNFRGNGAEQYYFRMGGANDVNTACSLIGNHYKSELTGLKTHEYLHFDQGNVTNGVNNFLKKGK